MKHKHTPGPWTISPYGQEPDGKGGWTHEGKHWHINEPFVDVHIVGHGGKNPSCVVIDKQTATANAHLIAAAPELLEAAELMLAFYDDLSKSNPGFIGKLCLKDYEQWNLALLKLPAAIAKAKGQQ